MLCEALLTVFEGVLPPDRYTAEPAALKQNTGDASHHHPALPDLVVYPESTAEVSLIVRTCNEQKIPIVARGAGTSIEGNPIPTAGGVVLNFDRMNRVLAVYPDDLQVVVQAGVRHHDLNDQLAADNLFYVPMLGPNAAVGGILANNAAGYRTVRYGAAKDNVLALEVVLANGDIMRTGSRAIKQSAGYDLTHLIVGSEGTLGIITEATLQLHPKPAAVSAAIAGFTTVEEAADAVVAIKAADLAPTALELLDVSAMQYLSLTDGIDFPIQPTLLMEFSGATEAMLQDRLAHVKQCCDDNEATYVQTGIGELFRDHLWRTRVTIFDVMRRENEGLGYYATDSAVPVSQLPTLIRFAADLLAQSELEGNIVSHAGDGNVHVSIFYRPYQQADAFVVYEKLIDKSLALNGTITGEHGVGIGKVKYMSREHDPVALNLMKTLKRTLDPHNILNPGKVLPMDESAA